MSPDPKPSKTSVVTDFRRSQILEAARESFVRHGLAGTTVDGIAKTAGVAKGTVYLYYKSKDELLRQLLDEDVAELRADTLTAITGPGRLDEKLHRFLVGMLAFFDRKRDFVEHVHFEMGTEIRKKAQQQLERAFRDQVKAWTRALSEAHAEGVVGDLHVPSTARALVALAQGLAKQRLRGWSTGSLNPIAAQASALLWKGLAAR
jgi:TetR/AcrR family fatty acid metabolism transcriptional regulator